MSRCQPARRYRALIFFILISTVHAVESETWVRVKADRVNLRARPDANSEVVAQVQTDDRLSVVSIQGDWVEIVPPDTVDVWAYREFIQDGVVTVNRLNIRAGPGINFSIVGSIPQGQLVVVRGQFGEWVKIPPANATLWVSREFVEILSPTNASPPPTLEPPSLPSPTVAFEPPSPASSTSDSHAVTTITPSVPSDLQLVPLEGQGRSVRREGELKPAPFLFYRPSAFRLVRKEGVQLVTICYVRGNTAQLNSLLNQQLIIYGREYWVQGVRQPVLLPERIERRTP